MQNQTTNNSTSGAVNTNREVSSVFTKHQEPAPLFISKTTKKGIDETTLPKGFVLISETTLQTLITASVTEVIKRINTSTNNAPINKPSDTDRYNHKQACNIIGITSPTLRKYKKEWGLEFYKEGHHTYYTAQSISKYLKLRNLKGKVV